MPRLALGALGLAAGVALLARRRRRADDDARPRRRAKAAQPDPLGRIGLRKLTHLTRRGAELVLVGKALEAALHRGLGIRHGTFRRKARRLAYAFFVAPGALYLTLHFSFHAVGLRCPLLSLAVTRPE